MPKQQDIRTRYASAEISNAVFYVPFAYLYQVRLGTPWKLLSWLLIYLVPCAFYGWLASPGNMPHWLFVFNLVSVAFAVITIYELGYIFNDTRAILREAQPAIRLYKNNFDYFALRRSLIVTARIIIASVFLTAFVKVNTDFGPADCFPRLMRTVDAVLLIVPVFAIYNYWRGKWNVLLYPVLLFSRYLPFLMPYDFSAAHALLLFMCVPCLSAVERFSMPRHRFPLMRVIIPDEDAKTWFRVGYYCVVILLLHMVMYFCPQFLNGVVPWASEQSWMLCSAFALSPFYVLLAYRFAVAVFTRFVKPRNYLNG